MKRQTLGYVVVALWLSCSPDYKSGVTECDTDGKCPNGYVCGASTAGGADVCYSQAETNPGSGGGGGSGPPIGPCTRSSTDGACAICGKQFCCSQVTACESQPSCLNLLNCIGECPSGGTTCMNGCETSYPSGVANLDSFAACLTNYCSASCSDESGGGGSGGNGGVAGGGGTSGSASTIPSPSSVNIKFCQSLSSSSQSLTLTLNVNGTKISSTTGNCEPVDSCLAVPAGTATPISLMNGSTTLSSGTINLIAGTELLIRATLDSSSSPTLESNRAGGICSGGTGTAGTQAKFCNFLQKSNSTDFLLTLNVGGASFSAMSGTCSPIGSCTSIQSGTNVSMSLLDGSSSVSSGTYPTIAAGANMVFRADMDDSGSPTVFGSAYATGICSSATGTPAHATRMVLPTLSSSAGLVSCKRKS